MIVRALWLNGTVGVGKTTVGAEVANQLATSGDPVAFVDIDALGDLSPRPPDDPFNTRLVAKNLEALTKNFSTAGARTLVVAGVIETEENLRLYESAVGAPITLVRLVAPSPQIQLRLRRRDGEPDPGGLRWHSERAPVLAACLDVSGLPMIAVANSGHPKINGASGDCGRRVLTAAYAHALRTSPVLRRGGESSKRS